MVDGVVYCYGGNAESTSNESSYQENQHNYCKQTHSLQLKNTDVPEAIVKKLHVTVRQALHNLKTIAVSVTDSKDFGFHPVDVAEAILGSVLLFLSDTPWSQIQRVYIVVKPKDNSMFKIFNDVLLKMKAGSKQSQPVDGKLMFMGTKFAMDIAATRCREEMNLAMMSVEWSNSPLRKHIKHLTQKQVAEFTSVAKAKNLDFEINQGELTIKLEGLRADVEIFREKLNAMLLCISHDLEGLPDNWTPGAHCHEVLLDKESKEYIDAKQNFVKSTTTHGYLHVAPTVKEIYRIQNKELYQQYVAYKRRIQRELDLTDDPTKVEWDVWHGTNEAALPNILSGGFNRSFATSENFGKGTYFSPYASTSVGYARRYNCDRCFILQVKAAIGKNMQGLNGMLAPPPGYHSTADRLHRPNELILFNDAAAYPVYKISFSFT